MTRSIVLIMDHSGIRIAPEAGFANEPLPTGSAEEVAEALVRHGCRRVTLALGAGWAQVRRVAGFPPVPIAALRTLLSQQPLKYLRPVPGTLVTDAAWTPADKSTPTAARTAVLAGADADAVADVVARLQGKGLRVDRVVLRGFEGLGINLMPVVERRRRRAREWRSVLSLLAALFVVWSGYGVWHVVDLQRSSRRLAERLAELEPAGHSIALARRAVGDAEAAVAAIDSVRGERGRVLGALRSIAGALPGDAFLVRATLSPDSVGLVGYAGSPAAVIKSLASRSLVRPTLLPPEPRGGGLVAGRTRFELVGGPPTRSRP